MISDKIYKKRWNLWKLLRWKWLQTCHILYREI